MTLDEAIVHARQVASEQKRRSGECVQNDSECDKFSTCLKCAEEHEQLAEWLEELKAYRASVFSGDMTQTMLKEEYCKAVDDFVNACKEDILCQTFGLHINGIERIAEQLKAGDGE